MNKSKNYHTDPLFKTLKIMKVDEIQHFKTSKLAYKVKEKNGTSTNTRNVSFIWEKNHNYNTW